MAIRTGTTVKWKWGSSWAEGTVKEVHHDDVSRTTKGNEVTRHGSDDDPLARAEDTAVRLYGVVASSPPDRRAGFGGWAIGSDTERSPEE